MKSVWPIVLLAVLGLGCGPSRALKVIVESAGLDGTQPQPMAADSTLTPGSQGGFHVWVNVRLTGATAARTRIKHTIRRKSDGTLFSTGERTVDVVAGETWESSPAWPAFVCPSPLGINILNVPAVIKLELSTIEGVALGSGEATTTFACPAAQQAFCESICQG